MERWAEPELPRDQIVLFPHRLDEVIPDHDPVRLLDQILRTIDWTPWEARYDRTVGRPPYHPRMVAAAILHGLTLGVRASRKLEDACKHRVDFMWLVEGQTIDHSTFCGFINRFSGELGGLFEQVVRLAMGMGLVNLNLVVLDGTRVRANSSRHATATAKTLRERLARLREEFDQMLAEVRAADERDQDLFGEAASPTRLPRKLATAEKRLAALEQALAAAEAKEAEQKPKAGKSKPSPKGAAATNAPAQAEQPDTPRGPEAPTQGHDAKESPKKPRAPRVPVADPESSIQKNKDGGSAPNYTPTAAVDGERGYIVDGDVLPDSNESAAVLPTVDRVEETFGRRPEQFAGDGGFASGPNLAGLDERGIEAFIPLEQREDRPDNPARRADPRQPVPEALWDQLPRNTRTKKLDRAAFVYDREADCYYCPLGHRLGFWREQDKGRDEGGHYRLYRCRACPTCPLAGACVRSNTGYRTVSRDEHEDLREAMDARMGTERGQAIYARRAPLAETPFARIKQWMHLRQFLRRGLRKVRVEWVWACTAHNLKRLVRDVVALRLDLGAVSL